MTRYLTEEDVHLSFMKFPRFLLSSGLNETCQILYVMLMDRGRLSQRNGWVDKNGRVFIYYPIKALAKDLHKGLTAIKDSLKKLESQGLIERVFQGASKPSKIYVKIPEEAYMEVSATIPAVDRPQFRLLNGRNSVQPRAAIPATNKNNRNRNMKSEYLNYDCGGNTL